MLAPNRWQPPEDSRPGAHRRGVLHRPLQMASGHKGVSRKFSFVGTGLDWGNGKENGSYYLGFGDLVFRV